MNADEGSLDRGTSEVDPSAPAPTPHPAGAGRKHRKEEGSPGDKPRNRLVWAPAILVLTALIILTLVPLALEWKSGQSWEDFLQIFVTSPAAAGCAAVLAAVIASVTFNRGLTHTKEESQATRRREAAEAWWQKFEWVTDRLIPKDSGQEKIAKPLAADLLASLSKMAAEDFQRAAILGVTSHYFPKPEEDAPAEAQIRDINAEARSFRNLAESINSPEASFAALAAEYDQAGLAALSEFWEEPHEVQILPRYHLHPGRVLLPDAVLKIAGREIAVDFKAWNKFHPTRLDRITDRFELAISQNIFTDILVVSMAELPETFVQTRNNIHVVHWSISEGAEILTSRITALVAALPPISAKSRL